MITCKRYNDFFKGFCYVGHVILALKINKNTPNHEHRSRLAKRPKQLSDALSPNNARGVAGPATLLD